MPTSSLLPIFRDVLSAVPPAGGLAGDRSGADDFVATGDQKDASGLRASRQEDRARAV